MARTTFADALKKARLEAGLSQAALARRAQLTGSYISVLESRRRPPPSPKVVKALCKALDIEEKALLEAAALERAPPTVRKRLERMRKERGRVVKARDRLLTTTLFHVAKRPHAFDPTGEFSGLPEGHQAVVAKLLGRFRRLGSVDEARAQSESLLEGTPPTVRDALVKALPEALEPAEVEPLPFLRVPLLRNPGAGMASDEHVILDPALGREISYAWRAVGDDAYPRVEPGDLLLIAAEVEPASGALVLFRKQSHLRLGYYAAERDEVRISFPRPELPPLRFPAEAFRLEGVVRGVIRSLT